MGLRKIQIELFIQAAKADNAEPTFVVTAAFHCIEYGLADEEFEKLVQNVCGAVAVARKFLLSETQADVPRAVRDLARKTASLLEAQMKGFERSARCFRMLESL